MHAIVPGKSLLTLISLCCILCVATELTAQDVAGESEKTTNLDGQSDFSGTWVMNQGVLILSGDGSELEGTLDEKTKVTGKVQDNTLELEYRKSVYSTKVKLTLSDSQRWLMGESKTGRSTAPWYGCRQEASPQSDEPTADYSGHWLHSWGMMQFKQSDDEVTGRYGADEYGQIEGQVAGPRLTLVWKRYGRKGSAWMEQSPDGKYVVGQTLGTDKPSLTNGIRAEGFERNPTPIAGETVKGISDSGMLYHLRMPDDWEPKQETDLIVLFHGSNFTTTGMVFAFAKNWPDLAQRFAILGVQGEKWAKWSTNPDLRFNYTYASWVGRSTYGGYPYTDRESPALVMNLIDELDEEHSFGRIFVGGHSQGGFLTYMMHMHFPEKLAGSFPIAGGIPFQSEPRAFDDQPLMDAQRETPMVIIHGSRDRVVPLSSSTYAYQKFLAHGFSQVKMLVPEADHPFDFLPVGDAIRWLDNVSVRDAAKSGDWLQTQIQSGNWRDVGAAIAAARSGGDVEGFSDAIQAFETAASEEAAKHLSAIEANTDGAWVDDYIDWNEQFIASEAAQPVVEAFQKIAEEHSPEAKRLESEARKLFRERKSEEGWEKYREIISNYYASPQYRTLKDRVEKHFAPKE